MKPITYLVTTLLLCTIQLFSQEKLKVEYNVEPYYESPQKDDLKIKSLPTLFELIIDKDLSAYHFVPKIDNTQKDETSALSATMSASTNPVYQNTETKTYIEEAKIQQKQFLIKDTLPQIDWKITKETKEIAGFPVLKATAILSDESKTELTAWYTPKLNFKNGPDKFWGLPGLILEVETQINYEGGSKEGTRYIAEKVEILNTSEKSKIPTKGKEISQQEFIKKQKENLQKQMEMFGGGVDKD